jgi:hypothetical protein
MFIKAFRLFVSSTFADFTQERELLQNKVFPTLDAYCAAKGYQFQLLDLRWGISEEAQLNQRAAEICLDEVCAAKGYPPPNFLIMIGNRYGWVPLPYAIARDEFEAVVAWLKGRGQRDAARDLDIIYQHDDNHLVPRGLSVTAPNCGQLISAYTLRSREDDVPELKPAKAWAKLEASLRRTLQEAADDLLNRGQINVAAHEKYFQSLTEQEIIHGLSGYNHGSETRASSSPLAPGTEGSEAIAFIREIVGNASATLGPVRAFLRKIVRNGTRSLGPMSRYIEQEPRLDALKDRIKHALPDECIVTSKVGWGKDGRIDPTYLAAFAAQIQSKLVAAIDRHIARIEAVERVPDFALESERGQHRAFGEQKRKVFIGRESNLVAIQSYIAGDDDYPLILYGRSGFGKSALMARALAAAQAAGDAPVIYRFIGASAASSQIRSLLVSLVDDLASLGIVQMPEEFEQDAKKFNDRNAPHRSSSTRYTR